MKRLLSIGILFAVLLVANCYPVENAQIQKPEDHKMTGGDGDSTTQQTYKPEDMLELVMTAGEDLSQKENPNHSPLNRTRLPSGQLPAGKPDESSVNNAEESELIQDLSHLLTKESQATEFEVPEHVDDEEDLFEGDIKLTPKQKAALQSDDATIENWRRNAQKWPRDGIPYVLDTNLTTRAINAISDSIQEYHTHTCLRFRRRTTDSDYLRFINSNGCWSYVGRIGGGQDISIASGCTSLIPAHEIFHALGRWHEQSRPDRDNFITVNLNNVRSNRQHNFRKYNQNEADVQGIPYDFDSLMHYGPYSFAINRNVPVIQPRDSSISLSRLGQRDRLSAYDITQVNIRYCPEYIVQLRGGSNKREGRVEVNLQSADWGTVCDDYFGINDANVICKFLGFPGATEAYRRAHFGQGSGFIWLDNLHCVGSESTPFHCPHNGFGVHNCRHSEDASVRCTPPPVRLVGGSGRHEGRVEIFLHDEWGTICDDYWDLHNANVVCKQLGYSMGASAARGSAHFGEGSGIIWFDDVQCTGSEAHLYDCINDGVGIHNCRHYEDAGVTCRD